MPMLPKNASRSTGWAAVSSWRLRNRSFPASTSKAKSMPPTTAAGMFSRSSQPDPLAELEADEVEHRRDAQRLQEIQFQVQHVR